jgi:general secretion pathway protein D
MRKLHCLMRILAAAGVILLVAGAGQAGTRKADKLMAQGKKAEQAKKWDEALDLYEKALADDPGDPGYQLAVRRVRFQAAQKHVDAGQQLRVQGDLDKALAEFQKAYAIDPGSMIAEQELRRTAEMIERNKAGNLKPEERVLTPAELARKQEQEKLDRLESVPELKPISSAAINLKMTNQPPRVLFETVAKLAGLNVVFDPDYGSDSQAVRKNISVELNNSTLDDALDYLATMTRSFWKPLSGNAIFVTTDNPTKRRDFEGSAVKVFYLTNSTTPQELQEMS